jgi:hypothetical protein
VQGRVLRRDLAKETLVERDQTLARGERGESRAKAQGSNIHDSILDSGLANHASQLRGERNNRI